MSAEELAPALKVTTWSALESALRQSATRAKKSFRSLTDAQRDDVSRAVGSARFWRAQAQRGASAEDSRATLAALAKIAEADAPAAFARCDVTTRARMFDELVALGIPAADVATGAEVKACAAAALAHFPSLRRGPRHTWRRGLASDALDLWRAFGGAAYAGAAKIGYATPLVDFAVALFDEVEPKGARGVADLLAEMQKTRRDK